MPLRGHRLGIAAAMAYTATGHTGHRCGHAGRRHSHAGQRWSRGPTGAGCGPASWSSAGQCCQPPQRAAHTASGPNGLCAVVATSICPDKQVSRTCGQDAADLNCQARTPSLNCLMARTEDGSQPCSCHRPAASSPRACNADSLAVRAPRICPHHAWRCSTVLHHRNALH